MSNNSIICGGTDDNGVDFWSKTNTYAEQPKVKLTYDVITVLEGERTLVSGQKQYLRILPSSMPTRIQQLLQESMRASQIKVRGIYFYCYI